MTDLYEEIPANPDSYTAGTVLGRMVDGIGFRYRWATEDLTDDDLTYRPSSSSRTLGETLWHIHNLIVMTANGFTGDRYMLPEPAVALPFTELRRATLERMDRLSTRLKGTSADQFNDMPLRFNMGGQDLDFPFWNGISGSLADALYHVGQVVAYRRAAGNPIDPQVNVFVGKKM